VETGARHPAALLALLFVVLSVAYYAGEQIRYSVRHGDDVSDVLCTYSEANDVRAGECYVDHGFTSNYGLADIAYGHAMEHLGSKHDPKMCALTDTCVYLHTPPGTELLTGVATRLFGKGHIARFRAVPLTLATLALAFLAFSAVVTVGAVRAAFVLATFHFVPMITAGMHSLCFVNYELALLEVELGVLLLCFFRGSRLKTCGPALFVVGFFSGWISFDYAVHVALLATCVWLLRGELRAHARLLLWCTAASCAGYLLACGLHLYQVATFLGSWKDMWEDYTTRGLARLNGRIERRVTTLSAAELLRLYLTKLVNQPQFFRGNYVLASMLTFVALLVPQKDPLRLRRARLEWAPAPSLKWSFVVAFVIPLVWIVVVRQHASAHTFYVPRNFAVTFLVGALALALGVRSSPPSTDRPSPPR
jgi:hypothetical protein